MKMMTGYYGLSDLLKEKLPVGCRDIEENIYELCCPLVVEKSGDLPSDLLCLYETLEVPIITVDNLNTFCFEEYNDFCIYLKNFSKYLKLNIDIEMLEEGKLGHLLRVGKMAKDLCISLNLSCDETKKIYIAALFHDIGKYKVPNEIVGKKGKLSEVEFSIIKKHCEYSYDILKDFLSSDLLEIIKSHHERCDGSGYPRGVIPNLGAKILGIVDSFDAMTSNRVYHNQKSSLEAYKELELCVISHKEGGKGRLFDKQLVQKFIEVNN